MRRPNRLPRYPYGSPGVTDVINLEDNEKINFGDAKDMALYWDGTSFVMDDAGGTRSFRIENATANYVTIRGEATHFQFMPGTTGTVYPYIKFSTDDHVRLYLKAAKSFYIFFMLTLT